MVGTNNVFERKKISIKFKKIQLKPKRFNITQTVVCQELLARDYKIYPAFCCEKSKTQYVHCAI